MVVSDGSLQFTGFSGPLAWLVPASGLLLMLLANYVFYQLYFHPLAKYPGPILARLTQWHDVYHAYIGDKHVLQWQMHQQYGPIVRISPNTLSINDPAALKTIYSHGANAQKSIFYKMFRARPDAISTFLSTEKQEHARKRRVMGQAFSDTALRGLEGHVLEHVNDFVNRIGELIGPSSASKGSWSAPVDMCSWCNWLVFDIMGDLVFGRTFGTLGTKPENRQGIYFLGQAARRNYVCGAMPLLAETGLEKYLPFLRHLYLERCKYLAFGKQQVLEVMERNKQAEEKGLSNDRKDIFSCILRAKDPETGHGFAMNELWMEGNTLIVAGSDSTSTTLSATLFYLCRNPETLRVLTDEIRSTFSSRDSIRSGPELQGCSYLRACLDETMRMTPAIPGILPREVLAGGLELPSLGVTLPAGTHIGVPIYAIHHHEDYVVDPFVYDPTRWLEPSKQVRKQDKEALQAVFNPFSIGPRTCLAKPLVYMEVLIAVSMLVWEFDMRLADNQHASECIKVDVKNGKRHHSEYHLIDWFMSHNEGPWLEMRPRLGDEKS